MKFEYSSLLNEFALHFPTLDFSKVDSGYDQVEKILLDHIKEFTPEQWAVITDSKYSNLFQTGSPHVNWNTDRHHICDALIANVYPCKTWLETWYEIRVYSVQMGNTILEIKVEEPRVWSSYSMTRYRLTVAKVFTPVPTHRAVILAMANTKVYIKDQFAGSLNECEEWVAKNVGSNHFKIMKI